MNFYIKRLIYVISTFQFVLKATERQYLDILQPRKVCGRCSEVES